MKKIVLIACASKKLNHKAAAQELYISPLFKYNLQYAKSLKPDQIFILSAKYGLVPPDQELEPYNVTLKQMTAAQARAWAKGVLDDLARYADLEQDLFIFLAGQTYRKYLVPHLRLVEIPLEGKPIGKQLQFLSAQA